MSDRCEVLREVMLETGTTQSGLSRLSGVRRPSISGFLSVGSTSATSSSTVSCHAWASGSRSYDALSSRSLPAPNAARGSCTGGSPRFWASIASRTGGRPSSATSTVSSDRFTGQPHVRNLDRWRQLVDRGDLPGLHRVLTGLDRDSIEMREVSPMSGLLPDDQRHEVLKFAG